MTSSPLNNTHMYLCIDPADQIKVSISRPFGIDLEEAEEGKASGVFIRGIFDDGNAAKIKELRDGLFMMSVDGVDVRNMDFDNVIDTISSMPQDRPVDCVFIDPNKVMKGPAVIDVRLPMVHHFHHHPTFLAVVMFVFLVAVSVAFVNYIYRPLMPQQENL